MAENTLFNEPTHVGRRVVVTGQVGMDKKEYLERVVRLAAGRGHACRLCNIGDLMYADAPDVRPGRILDLPISRLNTLRRGAFKDALHTAEKNENVIINTHACFRWHHGLFLSFDFEVMRQLNADLYITLVDNVDAVHQRMKRDHSPVSHTLKDLMVWREEEMLATEILARAIRGFGHFFIMARGVEKTTEEMLYRLLFEPGRKRVYPSFPMSHVMDLPETLGRIDAFRAALAEHFITFDPGDLDEKRLHFEAIRAAGEHQSSFRVQVGGREETFQVQDILQIASDIDDQIYARDFKLIDQADMIVSLVPELPGGKPGLSSGVERELQHAWETTKEVYVVWEPKKAPSPFITETCTKWFHSVDECMRYFHEKGYIKSYQPLLPTAGGKARQRGRIG